MMTGRQTEPLPSALMRGRAGPPLTHVVTTRTSQKQGLQSRHAQTPHRVCLRHLRSCDCRPGALRMDPWQSYMGSDPVIWISSQSEPRSPSRWDYGGSGHLPDWLSTCCSPICPPAPHRVTTGLSFTLLQAPPSLSISSCQVAPNTCPLSHEHGDVPALPG